jgi:hypothetical protein
LMPNGFAGARMRAALLVALWVLPLQAGLSQQTAAALVTTGPASANNRAGRKPVESEVAFAGMFSYGNYRIFGAAPRCNIWSAGVEYDRHSWGHLVKARIDYVFEVLPFALLSEPAKANFWGGPESPDQQWVHGVGVSPFGFRFVWRDNARVQPYMMGNAGGVVFPRKILSPNASYANFNFQGHFGLQIRTSGRADIRLEPLVYFHVSNGYFAASNPGFDQLGARVGISYHLGRKHIQ